MKNSRKVVKVFLLSLFLTAFAWNASAQKVTLSFQNETFEKVLTSIKKQTGLSPVFSEQIVDLNRRVHINVSSVPVEDALNQLLTGTNISFEIKNKKLYLVEKKQEESSASKSYSKKSLTGVVTDDKGNPVIGASVLVKGTSEGTMTDLNGRFNMDVSPKAVLKITYLGFQPMEVGVNNERDLRISLVEGTKALDEVVIVGYGTQKKKDLTGAISVVSSKEFEAQSTANMGDALEGKISGVQISKPSGQPQSGYSFTIRGISTITAGSDPLFIVDGVPTTSINQIEPTDIESISVLKDASAAAIYGASGSNGVVLITTKRGSDHQTRVGFNSYYGVANVTKTMDVLNATQYKDLMTEMGYNTDWSLYNNNTNWQDEVFRTGQTQSYQSSVSGGNEKTTFYLSGSFFNQDGVIIANSMKKYSFRANLDHKLNNYIKVGTSLSYNKWNDIGLSEGGRWTMGNSFLTASPVIGIYNTDGSFTADPFLADLENPVSQLTADDHGYDNYRFNGNAYAEISLAKDLKFKSMLGVEENNSSYHSWIDPLRTRQGRTYKGIASYSNSLSFYWINENTLTYNKEIGKHKFNGLVGYVASKINSEGSDITGKKFGSTAVHTVNAATEISAGYSESAKTNESYLGRLNYTYDDKYLLTANFRADGSSVFGANYKWGYFPSFSAGWRLSQEGFWNQNSVISDLKLRAGWGEVGNDQIGNYASWGLVSPSANYVIGGVQVSGAALSQMENADLRWEKTEQTNLGLDASFLRNRIVFTADYYIKKTHDMLLDAPIPYSVGTTSTSTKNVGSMDNHGVEFQVSSRNLIGELKWTSDFNISFNRSKITKLADGNSILGGSISNRSAAAIAEEGHPLGTFYGYISEGVDPATGNIKYKDLDNSGDLSDGDKTNIGNANPDFTYGLTNAFSYKGVTFSFFFQGVQGNQIFNASRIVTEGMYYPVNQLSTVMNRWKNSGDITDMPKSDPGNLNHNSDVSSRYVEDGSYLRLKSATLGYNLPQSVCNLFKAQKLYIYITGQNLLTFTKYSGYDPEVSAYGNGIASGIDFGSYPQSRSFLFGLNLNF